MIRQTFVGATWFATMMVAACFGANADTSVTLASGNSIQTDGWNIAITSCTYTALGGTSTSCNPGGTNNLPAGDILSVVTSTHGADFQLTNLSGPVLSITSTASAFVADINYTVKITPVSSPSTLTLDSVSAAVNGTTSNSNQYLSDISVGVGVTTASGTQNFTSYASGTTTGPITFAPTSLVTLSYDVKLNAGSVPGITLTVPNQPTNAPEPATLLVFGPAFLALAKMRRSRKRDGSSTPSGLLQ